LTSPAKNKRKAKRRRAYRRGLLAEFLALQLLRIKGYRLICKRYKKPVGEIDLLMQKKGLLIAVEVKMRQSEDAALHSIGTIQQRRIRNACNLFLSENPQYSNHNIRFDLVVVTGFLRRPLHLENAW
jgi:putative endonuclease